MHIWRNPALVRRGKRDGIKPQSALPCRDYARLHALWLKPDTDRRWFGNCNPRLSISYGYSRDRSRRFP